MIKENSYKVYVIPAQAGIQKARWIPAYAGMTTLLRAFLLVLFFASHAWAEGNYVNRSSEKLGRGVFNVVFSPIEITKAIESELKEGQPFKMVTLAPAKGILKMGERILVGSYETVTFFVPQNPILKPPYITPSVDENLKEKHEEKKDGPWSGLYAH